MDFQTLQKFGLTEGESKVYLSLLKLGKSTIGEILKNSGVSHSKIYEILERLNKKGLIGVVIENNRRNFQAKSPSRLNEFLANQERDIQNKKEEFEKIAPQLQSIFENAEQFQEAEILQGVNGIKTALDMALNHIKKGDVIYVLGAPKQANEKIEAFFMEWHAKRISLGISCKMLYNTDAQEWAKKRNKIKLTETKILPNGMNSPVAIDIIGDVVITAVYTENPICFLIKNKEIAGSYKNYFEAFWKQAKS